MTRLITLAAAAIAGIIFAALFPNVASGTRAVLAIFGTISPPQSQAKAAGAEGKHDDHGGGSEGSEGLIKMTAAQISGAKIDVQSVGPGPLVTTIVAPAVVTADPDRVTRVAAKVSGTVQRLTKRLGDDVAKGEVIAVIESREVAEAKSELIAAQVTYKLQNALFERERSLFEKKILAEQQFLRSRTSLEEAQLRVHLARQKLAALDFSDEEISHLERQPSASLRTKEIRALGSGQIVERRVDVGSPVGGEGQEKELYVVSDPRQVWLALSIPVADLPSIKKGQVVIGRTADREFRGSIIFVSPALDAETRSAKVIASLPNDDLSLRVGAYLTARVVMDEANVDVRVPRSAIQTIGGETFVFVRTQEGFEKREVVLDKGDQDYVSVAFGLDPDEQIAVKNTFTLKADLGKAEAEHSH